MDKATLNNLHESYKKAWEYQKKAEGMKHDFDMGLQGVKSTYTFTKHGDAESLHRMVESMNHFLGKSPVGKLMVKYYKPHFQVLEYVLKAVNDNDNQLTKAIDDIQKQLEQFVQEAPSIEQATRCNLSEVMQGRISYGLYLMNKEGAVGNPEAIQQIQGFVRLVANRGESIMYNLDQLLTPYIRLTMNYEKLVQEGRKLYETNEAKGGLSQAFASKKSEFMEFDFSNTLPPAKGLLNSLLKNRNAWAAWLDQPMRTREEYF